VEKGFDADLVVLDGDPIADVRNLAKVATTIRAGQVIYQKAVIRCLRARPAGLPGHPRDCRRKSWRTSRHDEITSTRGAQ
jgi:hypothetical protein